MNAALPHSPHVSGYNSPPKRGELSFVCGANPDAMIRLTLGLLRYFGGIHILAVCWFDMLPSDSATNRIIEPQ